MKYISDKRKVLITPDEKNCIIAGLENPMYLVSIATGTDTLNVHHGPSKEKFERAKFLMKNNNKMTVVFSSLKEEPSNVQYVGLEGDDVKNIANRFKKLAKNSMVYIGTKKSYSVYYIQKIEKYKKKKCLVHVSQDGYLKMEKTYEEDDIKFVNEFGRKSIEMDTIVKSTRKKQRPDYYLAESSEKYQCAYWNQLWKKDLFWKEMKKWKESLDAAIRKDMKVTSIPNHIALKMVEKRKQGKDWWEQFIESAIVDEVQDLSFLFIRDVLVGHKLWIFLSSD